VIAHLSGTLLDKALQRLVIDVHGVGYDVTVPLSTLYAVGEPGAPVALRIHTRVTEEAIQLFGFHTALEQQLFERLIAVNGVGPKVALAVLSGIEPADLVRAVRQSDVARLTRIPGIGKKTAERLVLELKDRMPDGVEPHPAAPQTSDDAVKDDVISALINLGYQRSAIDKAVDRVAKDGQTRDFELLLRDVLKAMTGGR
jgi:Holliday junction DNA helicase RuvA